MTTNFLPAAAPVTSSYIEEAIEVAGFGDLFGPNRVPRS